MKIRTSVSILCAAFAASLFAASERPDASVRRIEESGVVLGEILHAGDREIPEGLLRRAQCVAVVPGMKRAGFGFGAQYGKGVVTCRAAGGRGWSAPSTIRMEGGSIGFQIGLGETDVVLVVMNRRGMQKLLADKFTLGGDASVMAGPLGRSAQAETDVLMRAEILAYSRSRGVFAGVSLGGATLRPDNDDNWRIYGRPVTPRQILEGRVTMPASARQLSAELSRFPLRRKRS